MAHAYLDGSAAITEAHIDAARALVDYAAESASLLLAAGQAGIDARIHHALTVAGPMSRDELRNHFHRHVSAVAISDAIGALIDAGLVTEERQPTAGRPRTTYCAIARKAP